MMDIKGIQGYLRDNGLDGWLMADFHGRNNIAIEMIRPSGTVTRRAFFFIPKQGEPACLVNPIERDKFEHLPGRLVICTGYKALEGELATTLKGCRRVAMEYSPKGRLPYVGLVDAGTIELVRGYGVEVVSSADLVAGFQARLSRDQVASHLEAAQSLKQVKDATLAFIGAKVRSGESLSEFNVVEFMLDQFREKSLYTRVAPMCSVDGNAGNPHYEPSATQSAPIKKGQLVLIDLWAKYDRADGVYADITWMAYTGTGADIPAKYREIFAVVARGRDRAVTFLQENIGHREVLGAEVDRACREVIEQAGYGPFFTHRTGHSIGSDEHGTGPNIDDLETEDTRVLQEGHLFSIEPGIYTKEFGFRSEINCQITSDGPLVTTLPLQHEIVPLL
jgi:Xaa-Pro aminopeptidase